MDLPDAKIRELMDMEFEKLSGDKVVGTIEVSEKHHQPFGYLHGGVSLLLAESAASIGAELASPENHHALGMEINANHLKSIREGSIRAVAEPVHKGSSTHVWSIEIRDDEGDLVCISRCTLAIRPE